MSMQERRIIGKPHTKANPKIVIPAVAQAESRDRTYRLGSKADSPGPGQARADENDRARADGTSLTSSATIEAKLVHIRLALFKDGEIMKARGPGHDFTGRAFSGGECARHTSGVAGIRECFFELLCRFGIARRLCFKPTGVMGHGAQNEGFRKTR